MAKVGLYCGHGTGSDGAWDPGCTYGNYTEAELMLPITRAAVKYLKQAGITVYTDYNNEWNARYQIANANSKNVDLFVSVHCDYSKAPSGVMPLYVSSSGKRIANCLNNAITNGIGIRSRGVQYRSDLWELNSTNMPAVILETGSISQDLDVFVKKYDTYGYYIAKGICDYLGVSMKKTGWIKDKLGWWFRKSNGGYPKSDWYKDKGKWYYFDKDGYMVTGWQKVKDKWYYLMPDGHMKTGWVHSQSKWYYMAGDGHMITNEFVKDKGKWYYFDKNGIMISNATLTADKDGAIQ